MEVTQKSILQFENEELEEDMPEFQAPSSRSIITQPFDFQVRALQDMEQEGSLILQPDFQRNIVWDDGKMSRLIESILLNVPLPLVYLAENEDGKLSVIDGQQRLTAIIRYLRNEFGLRGINVLKGLLNKQFKHLDELTQKAIKNGVVRGTVIKKESDPSIRFEIFERLNTGATPLNPQELRNCVYRGPFNVLLKKLETYPGWLGLMQLDLPDKRMRDRELILRFFALRDRFNFYGSSMKTFLNAEMEERQKATQEQIQQYEALFKRVVRMSRSVFGDKAFRRFSPGTDRDRNGQWETNINLALYDAIMLSFAHFDERDVIPRSDAVRESLIELMVDNREFIESITYGTSSKSAVRFRVMTWEANLREICGRSDGQNRVYSQSFKRQLFEQNPTCNLCGNEIVLLDDAAVDHDHPWSLGGDTTPANGRLTHRYCNLAKSNRVQPAR